MRLVQYRYHPRFLFVIVEVLNGREFLYFFPDVLPLRQATCLSACPVFATAALAHDLAEVMQNQVCLWTPAELSGWLDKKGTGYNKWNKRFFILKGSGLFYFSDIKASTAKGVIPIELAKVEAARDKTEKKRFLIKVWVAAAYTDTSKHRKYILSSPSSQVQATWVTLLWYASVPRPDMLAQLHASGLLQSLLLKYMQAAYARMQTALIQDGTGRGSVVGVQADGQEPAQDAAVQEAMQLMFGQDSNLMPFTSDAEAAQNEDASPSYNPALMQRLSVLARGPGDTPSLRPFNMLGTPDIAQTPSAQFSSPVNMLGTPDMAQTPSAQFSGPPSGETDMYSSAGFQPQMLQPGGMQANMDQARLSMTGMVMGAGSADESWMHLTSTAVAPAIESSSTKPPSRKSRKHRNKHATADEHRRDPSEAGAASQSQDGQESRLQPEFSFSPLGDNSSCIQQEVAFSPLAVGAGQFTARPSIRQRIRKSLFGPAKDTAPGSEAKAAKAEVQHLPRMSAAYGFMANPAGLSPQLSQPVPAGMALQPRRTLLPASPMTAHATPKLLGQNIAPGGSRRSAAGESLWSGKPQQGGPAPAVGSPGGQPASGEASRGRSPVPDPTEAEDSPLSQVIQQQRAALKPVAGESSQEQQPAAMVEALPGSEGNSNQMQQQQHLAELLQEQQLQQQQQIEELEKQQQQLHEQERQQQLQEQLQEQARQREVQQQEQERQQQQKKLQQQLLEQKRQQQAQDLERQRQSQEQRQRQQERERQQQVLLHQQGQDRQQQVQRQQQQEQERQQQVPLQAQELQETKMLQQERLQQQQQQRQAQEIQRLQQSRLQQQQQQQQQEAQETQMLQQQSQRSSLDTQSPSAVSASGRVAGSSSSVAEDSDDAELQSLIQQQRIALRHLEALTERRAAQRTTSAPGDGASALPRRALAGRATTPEPDSPMSPLPQRTLFSRATTPVPDSPDRQMHSLTRLQQSPSMSRYPEATPLSPSGPPAPGPAPGGLQSQLAAVTLRHRSSSPTPTPQPSSSAKSAIVTTAPKGRSPPLPPPPPPPPLLSHAASPERLSKSSPSPGAVLQSPAVAARLISECYSDIPPAMSPVQNAHSQSNFSSQSSVSPHVPSPPPPPPPPPGAYLPNRSVNPQQQARGGMMQPLNPAVMRSPGQSQQPLAEVRQALSGDALGRTSTDSQGSPARQASSGKASSLGAQQQRQQQVQAQQQQVQAQQPIRQSLVQLRPVPQATVVQPGSSRQQEWQGQADDSDTSLSIGAVYSEMQQAGSLQSRPRLDQLQAAFKQGWPAVQTNPLYQKADAAAAVPGSAGNTPEKKRGWVVRSQPSIDTNRADGHTVQMLRQTWDKSANNIRMTQGQQPAENNTQYGLQAQLPASMMERRNKFSQHLQ